MYRGKRFHYIFNPKDGLPPEECQSVTTICREGMMADALATAVFVLGPQKDTPYVTSLKVWVASS